MKIDTWTPYLQNPMSLDLFGREGECLTYCHAQNRIIIFFHLLVFVCVKFVFCFNAMCCLLLVDTVKFNVSQ